MPTDERQAAQDRAVRVLLHYITMLMTRAGLTPDTDTHLEIAALVDDLVLAATPARLSAHAEAVEQLRRPAGTKPAPDPRD